MIRSGTNLIDGIPVEVIRKRIRCINIRVKADGTVVLSIPKWWSTLRQGEAFLREKWKWITKARAEVLSRPAAMRTPVTDEEIESLRPVLGELTGLWSARLHESGVIWTIRRVKSIWGTCHIRKRQITYNAELARVPRELVEYVVVHELTHLQAANHGPRFYALMDERLPGWKLLRRKLNKREFEPKLPPPPKPVRLVQSDFTATLFGAKVENGILCL